MAKKSRSKKKKSTKKDPERLVRNKRIAMGVAVVLGGAGAFVCAGFGIKAVDERAAELVCAGDPAIEVAYPTDAQGRVWLPRSETARIDEIMEHAVMGASALSAEPLREASVALERTGWVEGTPEARWTDEGSIVVSAEWRVPVAAVVSGGEEHLIDSRGVVLPLSYGIGQSMQFAIHNPARPMPSVGEVWDEPEIVDAIALRALLRESGLLGQIIGVDLGRGSDHGVLTLMSNNDARIVWGGGPGRERPAEMPTRIKIDRLTELQRTTGRIDASVRLVDIRGPEILMQRRER